MVSAIEIRTPLPGEPVGGAWYQAAIATFLSPEVPAVNPWGIHSATETSPDCHLKPAR